MGDTGICKFCGKSIWLDTNGWRHDSSGSMPICNNIPEPREGGKATLSQRWNKAASAAGAVGSEFIDDPERVFECLANRERFHAKLAHRKGELGIPLKDEDGKTLADFASSKRLFKRPIHQHAYGFPERSGQLREIRVSDAGTVADWPRLTAEDLTATDWYEVTE